MRILCAVDGSECSQWGVQALEALADREPEDVTLLHVVDPSAYHGELELHYDQDEQFVRVTWTR